MIGAVVLCCDKAKGIIAEDGFTSIVEGTSSGLAVERELCWGVGVVSTSSIVGGSGRTSIMVGRERLNTEQTSGSSEFFVVNPD